MNRLFKTTTGTTLGLLLTLLAGTPVYADDTELLLVDPNNVQPKPNIMFIIDSSGSMPRAYWGGTSSGCSPGAPGGV